MPTVPHIEIASHDGALVDRVRAAAAQAGRSASRVETEAPWSEPLQRCVRIVDLAHLAGRPAPGFITAQGQTDLVLVMPSAERQPCVRYHRYPRSALDTLLDEALHELPLVTDAPGVLLLGDSAAIRRVRDQIASVAPYGDVSVLVSGETGTGKELVAQAIHLGSRRPGAFVALNCAAVPEALFESELFGHEASASSTSARATRIGLLETAAQGTLFLDELGEMPQVAQARLQRAIETGTFRRLGSSRDIALQARIVSASHRPLHAAGSDGHLRRDLLYRLAGFTIELPSLRSRPGDVELLAAAFLDGFARRHRRPPLRLGGGAVELLREHSWPGNVRELRAVVEQAAIVASGSVIDRAEILLALRCGIGRPAEEASAVAPEPFSPKSSGVMRAPLRDVERELILRAFEDAHGNLTRAAADLGIPRTTLRDKLRRFGILGKAEES